MSPFRNHSDQLPGDAGLQSVDLLFSGPFESMGSPTMREATLDDVEDDCPLCQELKEQILAGNPPQVLVYDPVF